MSGRPDFDTAGEIHSKRDCNNANIGRILGWIGNSCKVCDSNGNPEASDPSAGGSLTFVPESSWVAGRESALFKWAAGME